MFLGVDGKQVGMKMTEYQMAANSIGVTRRLERNVTISTPQCHTVLAHCHQKFAPSCGEYGPHLTYGFLDRPDTRSKGHLDWVSHFSTMHAYYQRTDRQTGMWTKIKWKQTNTNRLPMLYVWHSLIIIQQELNTRQEQCCRTWDQDDIILAIVINYYFSP